MKIVYVLIALVAVGIVWSLEKKSGAVLSAQLDAMQQHSREREALLQERERLRHLQPGTEELAILQRSATEHGRMQRELAIRETPARRTPPAHLGVGEWLSPTAWKNQGQSTPAATVETTLWAAAGGDIASFKRLLQLDDPVRAKAEEILLHLPPASRGLYPSPEDLIAAFTTKAIPLGDAQLVWQHQSGADDAVACVFVKNTESVALTPSPSQGPTEKIPPTAPPSIKTKSAYLSLRRIDGTWRVVVPMSAVDKIAKEISGPPGR